MKANRILAASNRVLAFSLKDQLEEAEQKLGSELYALVQSVGQTMDIDQVRVLQENTNQSVRIRLIDKPLDEDGIDFLGRLMSTGRKSVPGFWASLNLGDNSLELGGDK